MVCTSLLWVVYSNIQRFLTEQSHGLDYTNTIDLKRKESSQGFMITSKVSSKDAELQKKLLDFTKNPALEKAYVFYSMSLPATALLHIAGTEMESDMFIFAASDSFFIDKNIPLNNTDIPIALNKSLLTMYNTQIANSTIFPELPEALL